MDLPFRSGGLCGVFVALLGVLPGSATPASELDATEAASPSAEQRAADRPGFYGRLGIGANWPDNSSFSDNNCTSTNPPALFGCVIGDDGRPLGAAGAFQTSPVLDAAVGYRVNDWLRAEALLSWLPNVPYSGQSNFIGAGADQPVSGSLWSLAGFGVAYVDLPRIHAIRPFIGAGLGLAHQRLGSMTYAFPELAANATTTTPGGASNNLAYLLTAGISTPLNNRLDLDLAYRFTDLGQVRTASGQAQVVRANGTRTISIGGTQAELRSHGVILSLRYAF